MRASASASDCCFDVLQFALDLLLLTTTPCSLHFTILLNCQDWIQNLPEGHTAGITPADIEKFRVGKFNNADEDVKKKWCHVMLHFLPCVCSTYSKWDIKKTRPVSKVSDVSDEALVLWFLQFYVSDWDLKISEDREANPHPEKRRKKEGKHKSQSELGEFLEMYERVKKARKETGNGWDEAIMEEAELQSSKSHQLRTVFTDGMPSAALASNPVVAKILVMPMADSDDDDGGTGSLNTPTNFTAV